MSWLPPFRWPPWRTDANASPGPTSTATRQDVRRMSCPPAILDAQHLVKRLSTTAATDAVCVVASFARTVTSSDAARAIGTSRDDQEDGAQAERALLRQKVVEIPRPPWVLTFAEPTLQPRGVAAKTNTEPASEPPTSPSPPVLQAVNALTERNVPLDSPSPLTPIPQPLGMDPLSKEFAQTVSEVPSLYVGVGERPLSLRNDGTAPPSRTPSRAPSIAPEITPPAARQDQEAPIATDSSKAFAEAHKRISICTVPDLRIAQVDKGKQIMRPVSVHGDVQPGPARPATNVRFAVPQHPPQPPIIDSRPPHPVFDRPGSPHIHPRPHSPRSPPAVIQRALTPPLALTDYLRFETERARTLSLASSSYGPLDCQPYGPLAAHVMRVPAARPVPFHPAPPLARPTPIPPHQGHFAPPPGPSAYQPPPLPTGFIVGRPGSTPLPGHLPRQAYAVDRPPSNPYFPPLPTMANPNLRRPTLGPQPGTSEPCPSPLRLGTPIAAMAPQPHAPALGWQPEYRPIPAPPLQGRPSPTHRHTRSDVNPNLRLTSGGRPAQPPFALNGSNWGMSEAQQAHFDAFQQANQRQALLQQRTPLREGTSRSNSLSTISTKATSLFGRAPRPFFGAARARSPSVDASGPGRWRRGRTKSTTAVQEQVQGEAGGKGRVRAISTSAWGQGDGTPAGTRPAPLHQGTRSRSFSMSGARPALSTLIPVRKTSLPPSDARTSRRSSVGPTKYGAALPPQPSNQLPPALSPGSGRTSPTAPWVPSVPSALRLQQHGADELVAAGNAA